MSCRPTMEDEDPVQVSVLISSTQQREDSSEEEDSLIKFPDLARHWVSTESLKDYARSSGSWWRTISGNLGERKTANNRCGLCQPCLDTTKSTCKKKGELSCIGCLNRNTCWGQSPCETWTEVEKARHYAQFSLQAYNRPSNNNIIDLITQAPYRLDLDLNDGTMVKLRNDPVS